MADQVTTPPILPILQINPAVIDPGGASLRGPELELESFKGLRRSISQIGVTHNITVYENPNEKGKYCLIDGLQRLTIAKELGLATIPCQIHPKTITPMQVWSLQVQANFHRVDTKPAAFGKQIRRFLMEDPNLTIDDIAKDLCVSVSWVYDRINLGSLLPTLSEKVDSGEIKASKAFWLAKLPQDEQPAWAANATKMETADFIQRVSARLKEIEKAKRTGSKDTAAEFIIVPRVRKGSEIKTEHETHAVRSQLVTKGMDPVAAFDLAIAWALKVDPITIKADKEEWDADIKAREAAKADRAKQREAEKAAKAAAVEAEAQKAREELAKL